eukprot:CAMPEP_0119423398 /NCGR_PEP_ID=MMETSP1335-20130426/30205_1 /TAXON_ID=259385 /ORGANISM="Chrysoculter rhomboideus, Strain RCC1486" /LENGTH=36 /DNA_ID= /DNA_START= /DNA_END= /DNA_ORIENTATION=
MSAMAIAPRSPTWLSLRLRYVTERLTRSASASAIAP